MIQRGTIMNVSVLGQKRDVKVLFADYDEDSGYNDLYNVCLIGYCAEMEKIVMIRYIASCEGHPQLSPLCEDLFREDKWCTRIQVVASKTDLK